MRTMPAGEFKAKCLAVMDEVQATGQPVIVTKRGKPVVRLSPLSELDGEESLDKIFGCLKHMVQQTGDLDDLVNPIVPLEEWDHLKEDWSPFPAE